MLNPTQLAAREGKLTASRVACLMTGDEAKVLNLWREMVGDPLFVPEDLSGVWPVQLGSVTENLNLDWYARKRGNVTRRGEVVVHPRESWMAATLDGFAPDLAGPIECKHVGGREQLSTIIERYQPQMHWQMIVTRSDRIALSVIEGANEPLVEVIERDAAYTTELIERATAFMECVVTLTPPFPLIPVAAPTIPSQIYDMAGNNEWADYAATWNDTNDAAKKAAKAEKELKALVPADATLCHGYGVQIKRDRAGRLSLRAMRED